MKKIIIGIVSVLLLVVLTGIISKWYVNTHPKTVYVTQEVDKSGEMFKEKIDSLQKSVVESVRQCESGGYKESDGLIKFDSNKVASTGTLQFQVHTVIYYYKTLYGQTITGKDAVLIALDDQKAGQLAQDIMFKSKNLANDWLNCSNKMKLTDQISAIKKIM